MPPEVQVPDDGTVERAEAMAEERAVPPGRLVHAGVYLMVESLLPPPSEAPAEAPDEPTDPPGT